MNILKTFNYKVVFRPICWIQEIYYIIRYNQLISGHEYKALSDRYDTDLKCEICGHISKGKRL